jgi:DNA-binding MarR family transcriptional regulator
MSDFSRKTGELLELEERIFKALGVHALTPGMRLLAVVDERGTVASSEARLISGLSHSEYYKAVSLLTERGLIRRLRSSEDRRVHLLERVSKGDHLRVVK